jgi:hypothetical protein
MADTGDTYDPDRPISVLGNAGLDPAWSAAWQAGQPSILGPALNPEPWTLANSTIHGLLSPEDIATIDFGDIGQPAQPPQPDASGFTGPTPWQPDASGNYQGSADAGGSPPPAASKDGWVQPDRAQPPQPDASGFTA